MKAETLPAREAARRRQPLDGADAQALEGALASTERERDEARAQVEALKGERYRLQSALGEIVALGESCDECDPSEAKMASHVVPHWGAPVFLCPKHAEEERELIRRGDRKSYGLHPKVEEHEQDTAVQIALRALGEQEETNA